VARQSGADKPFGAVDLFLRRSPVGPGLRIGHQTPHMRNRCIDVGSDIQCQSHLQCFRLGKKTFTSKDLPHDLSGPED
jgi:hypothetical protein